MAGPQEAVGSERDCDEPSPDCRDDRFIGEALALKLTVNCSWRRFFIQVAERARALRSADAQPGLSPKRLEQLINPNPPRKGLLIKSDSVSLH